MQLVKPMWLMMLLAILLGVAGFLCAIFITILGGYALLSLLELYQGMTLSYLFALVLLLAICRGILRYGEQASNHYIAFRVLAWIRDLVFQQLRKLAPAKLEGKEKGNLISIITSDIEQLEVFYAHTISPVVIALITCTIMLVYFVQFHYVLALIAFVAYFCVGVILPYQTSKEGNKDGLQYRMMLGESNTYFLDSIKGLKEVKQYDINHRLTHIDAQNDAMAKLTMRLKKHEANAKARCDSTILTFSFIMLVASLMLYHHNFIQVEAVILSTIAMTSSFGPVTALSNLANQLLHTFASGNRVLHLLEETAMVHEVNDMPSHTFTRGMDVKQVVFGYEEEVILNELSLHIPKNQIYGIVGKSGSGKSTLLKLLMRFFDTQSGEICLGDHNIQSWNTNDLRQLESYVIQDTYLFEDTILNNIKIANLAASEQDVIKACQKANIHDFIMSLEKGYQTIIKQGHHQLSGGERQRIGIARAFLHNSEIILLDEPTSNLDSLNEAIILKVLQAESKEKTVVLVSHRQSTMGIADHIISMDQGRAS